MKIELAIRRKAGSNTTIPNADGTTTTAIPFRPLDPSRADSPHVAEVTDEQGEFLLRLDPAYRIFKAASIKADIPAPRPATASRTAETTTPTDDAADTNGNGVLSVAEFNKAHAAGKFTPEALRELLATEEAADTPRASFIAAVTKALK